MKNISKLVSLSLGIFMSASLLSGCSTNGLALYNALSKNKTIKSSQTQFDLTLNVSAANMSSEEKQSMQKVLPFINNSKISILSTVNRNEENTKSQLQSDINMKLGSMQINSGIWYDVDETKDKPYINEIFKMPAILTPFMPEELSGKQYMVLNYDDLNKAANAPQIDFKKIMTSGKEFEVKFNDFVVNYVKQFNPSLNVITKIGTGSITQLNVIQPADIYQLKLDDKTFKKLLRYSLNNFSNNKDAINFIKYYVSFINSNAGLPQGQADFSEKELDDALKELPEAINELNKGLDNLDKIKIIGDKGITIRYAVNRDGYIINEKGNMQFVINLASLSKLENNKNTPASTGVYTVNLTFNNDIRNINGYNIVTFPELSKSNSFDYNDLLKSVSSGQNLKK